MELLKFLKELKNNKYLTLNQLEYDINKLKFMLDKPIKFNYVKPKTLQNYVNDLKTTSNRVASTARDAARQAFEDIVSIVPKYEPKSDDDINLILGFLLSLEDSDFSKYNFENQDDLLTMIALLFADSGSELNGHGPNEHGPNEHGPNGHDGIPPDRQFRERVIEIPYRTFFDMGKLPKTKTNSTVISAILNQIFSFLILSVYLLDNDAKACFPSTTFGYINETHLPEGIQGNTFVSIGTGDAISQWQTNPSTGLLFGSPDIHLDTNAAASYLSIQSLKNKLQEVYSAQVVDLGSGKIGFVGITQDNTRNKYGPKCAHVWGANIDNFNLPINTDIPGSNQATAFNRNKSSKQTPGVFGIISTKYLMSGSDSDIYEKVLRKRQWPTITDEKYILCYGVLKTIVFCNISEDRDKLISLIDAIMQRITNHNEIIRKLQQTHQGLYKNDTKPKPSNANEINFHTNPYKIVVTINNDTNTFFYGNKYLLLDLDLLNHVCTKNDNTIIFFNFEDLERCIQATNENGTGNNRNGNNGNDHQLNADIEHAIANSIEMYNIEKLKESQELLNLALTSTSQKDQIIEELHAAAEATSAKIRKKYDDLSRVNEEFERFRAKRAEDDARLKGLLDHALPGDGDQFIPLSNIEHLMELIRYTIRMNQVNVTLNHEFAQQTAELNRSQKENEETSARIKREIAALQNTNRAQTMQILASLAEAQQFASKIKGFEDSISKAGIENNRLQALIDTSRQEISALTAAMQLGEFNLRESQGKLQESQGKLQESQGTVNRTAKEILSLMEQIRELIVARDKTRADYARDFQAAQEQISASKKDADESEKKALEAEAKVAQAEAKVAQAEANAAQAEAKVAEAEEKVTQAEAKVAEAADQLELKAASTASAEANAHASKCAETAALARAAFDKLALDTARKEFAAAQALAAAAQALATAAQKEDKLEIEKNALSIASLCEEESRLKGIIIELKLEIDNKNRIIEENTARIAAAEVVVASRNKTIASLKKKHEIEQTNFSRMKKEDFELYRKELLANTEKHARELTASQLNSQQISEENRQIKAAYSELDSKYEELQREHLRLTADAKEKHAAYAKTNGELNGTLDQLQTKLKDLELQLKQRPTKEALDKIIAENKLLSGQLTEELRKNVDILIQLNTEIREREAFQREIFSIRPQLEELSKRKGVIEELNAAQAKINTLKTDARDIEEKSKRDDAEIKRLQKSLRVLKEQNRLNESQLTIKTACLDAQQQIHELSELNADLQARLSAAYVAAHQDP